MRSLVILSPEQTDPGKLAIIATRAEILHALAALNTGPESVGGTILFGPGIMIEMPEGDEPVTQMLLSITDDEISWGRDGVLNRLAKRTGWRLQDPLSGRDFPIS